MRASEVVVRKVETGEVLDVLPPYTPQQLEAIIAKGVWNKLRHSQRRRQSEPRSDKEQ
jgi:hypothetical protein